MRPDRNPISEQTKNSLHVDEQILHPNFVNRYPRFALITSIHDEIEDLPSLVKIDT